MSVTIIGLGAGGKNNLTLEAYEILKGAESGTVFFRTGQHPCAEELKEEGISFSSFDEIYESENSFEDVYKKIVSFLVNNGAHKDIVYAVPGNPFFSEKSVQLLLKELKSRGIPYRAVSGTGFTDNIACLMEEDLGQGFSVVDAFDLIEGNLRPVSDKPVLIVQTYDQHMLSEVKLALMKTYPDETEVYLIKKAGLVNEEKQKLKLFELDRQKADHLTSVFIPAYPNLYNRFETIERITRTLRMPGGCPWDREQTHESLKRYLIEEAAEVLDAIENNDFENLHEELGDLLFQVLIHAQIADEEGYFDIYDVIRTLSEKMVRRHPHVFGETCVDSPEQVIASWDQIKAEEKQVTSLSEEMRRIPKNLTALLSADKIQAKARKVGFDWDDPREALDKTIEEAAEVRDVLENESGELIHLREEIGDLLFAAVNVARLCGMDPEDALRRANRKFVDRFEKMENLANKQGLKLKDMNLEDQEELWVKAKS